MKIGFVSRFAPDDRKSSSGTNFKMFETLASQHDVTHIPYHRDLPTRLFSAAVRRLARARGRNAAPDFTDFTARRLARTVDPVLAEQMDLLVVPFGAPCLAGLETRTPVVYLSDTTFEALYGYYPYFSDFMRFNYRQGTSIERRALQKSSRVILGSDWAKTSAVEDYGQDPEKIHVIEYGANLREDVPAALGEHARSRSTGRPRDDDPLSLLFLGVDWERKGGDIAAECCRALTEAGIPARLDVVGTALPAHQRGNDLIRDHGFLNKNVSDDFERFNTLMDQADLLLLPTQAECSAIVYCEAAAYGLPAFTMDTGGVSNYVVNGVNGYRLPLGSRGADFAAKIAQTLGTGELDVLRTGAFRMYTGRLNWNHWLEEFNACVEGLTTGR